MAQLRPSYNDFYEAWEDILFDPQEVADILVRILMTTGTTSTGTIPKYLREKSENETL